MTPNAADLDLATTIRPARAGEAAVLTALCRRSKAYWGYEAGFVAAVADLLVVDRTMIDAGRVFVAVRDGAVVGLHVLRPWHGARATVELDALFVAPEVIATGVGRALWRHLVATALSWGGERLYIEADPNAVGFYRRMGATLTGERSQPRPPQRALPILIHALQGLP